MSKIHYFNNKFSKIAKLGVKSPQSFPPPAPLNLRYWWHEVPWFGEIVVFEVDYDEIVIVLASFQWRYHHYVAEKRHQNNVTKIFPIWGPFQSKFLATLARASAENFPGGEVTKKRPKISKKYRKIALFASSRWRANGKKTEK